MNGMNGQFVTTDEAARLLGRTRRTVYRMLKNGEFKSAKSFGSGSRKIWYIERQELESILAARRAPERNQKLQEPQEPPRALADLVNLTPHEVAIYTSTQQLAFRVPPSGQVARVAETNVLVGTLNGVPVYKTEYGDITDLPAPKAGVAYIVSQLLLNAAPERDDLYAPGPALRDEQGRVLGCVGLRRR